VLKLDREIKDITLRFSPYCAAEAWGPGELNKHDETFLNLPKYAVY
jgi:hypothetical protein